MLALTLYTWLGFHPVPGLLAVAMAALALKFYVHSGGSSGFPRDLPLLGEKPTSTRFSIKTRLAFYLRCSSLYHDVWTKFSRKGLPVLVPTLGTRKDIFLPHSSIPWIAAQPHGVLGMWDAFNEMFQLQHSLGHDKYMLDTWSVDVSRRALTQDLESFIPHVREELEAAVDAVLGTDTEQWTTLDLMDAMRMVINRAGARFAVGLPLCRDAGYLGASLSCIEKVVSSAGLVGVMPPVLRPYLGRVARWATRGALADLERRCAPMLRQRFAHVAASPDDASGDPHDLMQRMIRAAAAHRADELNTGAMTRRLLMLNLGFIYQAGFAATNVLRNILASDAEHGTVGVLRAEARRFAAAHSSSSSSSAQPLWTRQNVARMVHADSVARETLRLHTVPTRALIRQVMVDGLRTDTGLPLPRGALVSVVSQPMHTDPATFPDAHVFRPFRFVGLRNADGAQGQEGGGGGSSSKSSGALPAAAADGAGGNWSPHAFISTAELLVFGRGRNSCPGRFLIDFQLKMLIHHLLLNYDIKLVGAPAAGPPKAAWTLEFIFPPKGVQMAVRRLKRAEVSSRV